MSAERGSATCASQESLTVRRYFTRQLPKDIFWCAVVASVLTLLLTTVARQSPVLAWLIAWLMMFVICLGIGLAISTLYWFVFPGLARHLRGPVGVFASHALVVVSGVGLGSEVSMRVLALFSACGLPDRGHLYRIALVVTLVLLGLSLAFVRLELRAEQARRWALKAELDALQARTNPHFLFNSLNTVAGLIEEDTHAAERVLEKLSRLFRYALDGSKTPWVRLEQEIDAVQSYLDVEAIRLGARLQSSVEVDADVRAVLVPPLILQPLVENAVLHAIAPRKDGGRLQVRAARRGDSVELSVVDDGPGLGRSSHGGSGTSLENLRQRLGLVYEGRAQVDVASEPGEGVRVTLRLPLEAQA